MKLRYPVLFQSLLSVLLLALGCGRGGSPRTTEDFDFGWKFSLGDAASFSSPEFADSAWRDLHLPHDWSIEGAFSADNPSGAGGGALPGGIGWYRKHFSTPEGVTADSTGKRVYIEFDGVFMNSTVWINGNELGTRPYGYSSFCYELTPYLRKDGKENVIAVRCDNADQPNSRWYAGCGIYRPVRLVTVSPLHVDYQGTYVTTPEVADSRASVSIVTTVVNGGAAVTHAKLRNTIFNAKGRSIAARDIDFNAAAGEKLELADTFAICSPELWSTDNPYLYTVETSIVTAEGKKQDSYPTKFGVRTFAFDADKGFSLNGRPMKLKGVCLHHDMGALGTAVHRRALERQLVTLKEMGCNAIRTSHNPPAPQLPDLCDSLGLMVIDEAFDMWQRKKTTYDYARYFDEWHERDLTDFVRRDRNHPCVIMWSIGNEVLEQWNTNEGETPELTEEQRALLINYLGSMPQETAGEDNPSVILTAHLVALTRKTDPTRPVTAGCNEVRPLNNLFVSGALDVYGFNYHTPYYDSLRIWYPDKPLFGSETVSSVMSRGFYINPSSTPPNMPDEWWKPYNTPHQQCSAYDNSYVGWGDTHERSWIAVRDRDYMAGTFVWTGSDYLGEPLPYAWPSRSSYFGILDLCGFPKDVYYMYRSEWTDETTLHLLPHWNWKRGDSIDVWAYYNNADEVELLLNGQSLGKRGKSADTLHCIWEKVPFEPGTLAAVSYLNGKEVARDSVVTAREAASLRLTPDRDRISADGYDLSYVTVEAVDSNGIVVPTSDNMLTFEVSGAGELVGADNGNAADHLSLKGGRKALFDGKALAIIRSVRGVRGKAVLRVKGVGQEAELTITVK